MAKRKLSRSVAVATKPRLKKKTPRQLPATSERPSLYSVHPGVLMLQSWIAGLRAKTGRSLEEWIARIKGAGLKNERECQTWLKEACGLGTNQAAWLANKAVGNPDRRDTDSPELYLAACPRLVRQMYAGPKLSLKPLHDEIVRLAQLLGDDVKVCPCKTMVPLYRKHVFAEIKPATSKRLDLGLALGEEPFTARLSDTGGRLKKHRITHRVFLMSLDDIDLQVKRWLREAYEGDR